MTSTNYLNNFMKALKMAFRKNFAVFAVFQAVTALFSVWILSPYFKKLTEEQIHTKEISQSIFMNASVICLIQGIVLAVVLFREIYSRRAVDFMFALPVKRGTYYNANVVFGLLSIVISHIIYIAAVYFTFSSKMKMFDFNYYLKLMAVSLTVSAAAFAVSIFSAVLSGRVWHYIFVNGIAMVVVCTGAFGAVGYLNTIWGFQIETANALYVSPYGIAILGANHIALKAVFAVMQMAIAYTAGLFIFKRRKAEVAENALSGKFIPAVIITMCILSEILLCISVAEAKMYTRIIAATIVSIVTAVVLSAIFFRKPFAKPVIKCFGSAALISAVLIICVEIGPREKYISYIPKPNEIDHAIVYSYGSYGMSNITDLLYGISPLDNLYEIENIEDEEGRYKYRFASDEAKEKLFALHGKMVSDKTRKNVYSDEYYKNGYSSIKIEYILKNGRKSTRFYCVEANDLCNEFADLLKTEEGINQVKPFNIKKEDVLYSNMFLNYPEAFTHSGEEMSGSEILLNSNEYFILLEKIKKDMQCVPAPIFFELVNANFNYWPGYDFELDYVAEANFCVLTNIASKEQRVLLKNMTADEIEEYEDKCLEEVPYTSWLTDSLHFVITKDSRESLAYLEELGYTCDTKLLKQSIAAAYDEAAEDNLYPNTNIEK